MKKLVAFVCAAFLALGTVASAAPSITGVVESVVTVKGGTGAFEGTLSVSEAKPENYASPVAKAAVEALNDAKEPIEMTKLAEVLELKEEDLVTTKGTKIDLKEFSAVTKFMELGTDAEAKFEMTAEGTVVAEIAADVLKDVDAEDLENYVIMFVDPNTGKVTFIELDKDAFDPETGKIEVEFPALGAFTIMQKTA